MSFPIPISPTLSRSLSPVQGEEVALQASRAKHFINYDALLESEPLPQAPQGSPFYQNLVGTFNSLNSEIVTADKLTERFLVEPEKVNVHDVMIALQKSKLQLDLTRSVIQKSIESYNTLINLR